MPQLQGQEATKEEKTYFLEESFPRLVKSALVRKYDPTHANFKMVLAFLSGCAKIVAECIPRYTEVR